MAQRINKNAVVKVKLLNDLAELPFKSYASDFCYDVVATSREEVAEGVFRYGTGLAFQIERVPVLLGEKLPDDTDGGFSEPMWLDPSSPSLLNLAIDFRCRSSIWKTGLVLSNCIGTVDEGYTGEVFAVFYHVMPHLPIYEVGDRIGQIRLCASVPVTFREVHKFRRTERGSGGYGSTGR